MSTQPLTYNGNISSIEALQNRVQADESNLPGKLLSLEAKPQGFTEANYEVLDDVDGTGDVTLEEGGDNTAWIGGVETPISINQP